MNLRQTGIAEYYLHLYVGSLSVAAEAIWELWPSGANIDNKTSLSRPPPRIHHSTQSIPLFRSHTIAHADIVNSLNRPAP